MTFFKHYRSHKFNSCINFKVVISKVSLLVDLVTPVVTMGTASDSLSSFKFVKPVSRSQCSQTEAPYFLIKTSVNSWTFSNTSCATVTKFHAAQQEIPVGVGYLHVMLFTAISNTEQLEIMFMIKGCW